MTHVTDEQYADFEKRVEAAFVESFGGLPARWVMAVIYTKTDTMNDIQDVISPDGQITIDTLALARYAELVSTRNLMEPEAE